MALLSLAVFLLIPIAAGVRFCFVLRDCSDFVRHPSQRALPVAPWDLFVKRLFNRARIPVGVLLALVLLVGTASLWRADAHWGEHLFSLVLATIPLTQAVLIFLFGFLFLGRINHPAMLAVVAIGLSFVALFALLIVAGLLPTALRHVAIDNPRGLSGFSLSPVWALAGTLVGSVATVWWARRAGAPKWLGFEN
jgi:hypothetical protein